jgi:hypothetical protein
MYRQFGGEEFLQSTLKMGAQVPAKCWYVFIRLCDITSQQPMIFILYAIRTTDITFHYFSD